MKRRILSLLLAIVLFVSLLPTGIMTTLAAPTEVRVAASETVTYPVTGGSIYFDPETGSITDCDSNVTVANIPAEINGVKVVAIGDSAFRGCISLASVIIPDGVTTIGDFTFGNCDSLTSIIFPDSVATIGSNVFTACPNLIRIAIPDSVTTIGNTSYYSPQDIYYSGSQEQWEQLNTVFPNTIIHYNATMPDPYPVDGGSIYFDPETGSITGSEINITAADIPASINDIPVVAILDGAFSAHNNLTSVTIPDSVTTIGDKAFSMCSMLEGIWVDENNPNYCSDENGVLFNKNKTELLAYPEALGNIYTIPDGVTTIDGSAFAHCYSLTNISIPDSVTTIDSYAFSGCISLTSVAIPDGVTAINDDTFSSCWALASVTIPDGVTTIGNNAFNGCDILTDITIPDSVTTIGDNAFRTCGSLTSIIIPDGVTTIGYRVFYNCVNLTSVTIPDSVTTIGDGAFYQCSSLPEVTIPDGVASIGAEAFALCNSLNSITIPDSVTTIGVGAFYRCGDLRSIYYSGSQEQWKKIDKGNNDFSNVVIHYKDSSVHEHSYTVSVIAPTCSNLGYSIYTCICGDSYTGDEVSTVSHSYEGGYCVWCGVQEPNTAGETVLSVGSAEAMPGDTITVPVRISGNPGFAGYSIEISCDEGLTLTDIKKGDILKTSESGALTKNLSNGQVNWTDYQNLYGDGEILLLTLKVDDDTLGGDFEISIELIGNKASNFVNSDGENINVSFESGYVSVASVISIGSVETTPGQTVVVPVSIEQNLGFAGYTFIVSCDDGLTLKDIKKGSLSQESDGGALTKNIAKGQVNWTDYANLYGDGEILLLTFDVAEDAVDGDYGISIELKDNKATNFVAESGQAIGVRFESGIVTVANVTFGDLGGDGDVTASDSVIVARYLVDNEELDWKQLVAADVNHDGEVTAADGVRLAKYLVGLIDSLEEDTTVSRTKSIVAAKKTGKTEVLTEAVNGTAGETVTVPVSIVENTGFAGFTFEISCDKELTLTDVEKGSLLKTSESGALTKNIEKAQVNWTDSGNVYGDGELLLLTFEIAADADKDIYHASVKLKENKASNFVNEEGRPIAAAFDTKDASCPCEVFADSAAFSSWAHDGIDYCVTNGLMNGVGDGMFNPAGTLTRAQLVTILYRVAGEPAVDVKGIFTDVPADAWYAKAVEWAAANEIVKGIGNNKFAPDAPITREQIATILYRYDGGVKVEGSLEAYPDADKVGSYAVDGMLWAIENEIITGVAVGEATYLNPQENATREQIAAIMMRYLETE